MEIPVIRIKELFLHDLTLEKDFCWYDPNVFSLIQSLTTDSVNLDFTTRRT